MMDAFLVVSPGPYTTVQDRGRFDYQHMGIPVSGALDSFAFRIANLLVGNCTGCAALEMTFTGARLEALCEADIAVTGAEMTLKVNGKPEACWKSIRIHRGDIIRIGTARSGCRAYLAVTGGIDVPMVMGSRSTYVAGRLGGLEGRILNERDIIKRGSGALLSSPRSFPSIPLYPPEIWLRAIPDDHADYFVGGAEGFFGSAFTVGVQSDRMGYRLQGPELFREEGAPKSMISEPVMPGAVQVPPNGQAVILLCEQTLGGYTKIASVISPDLDRVAQAKPGDVVHFAPVTLNEAHAIYRDHTRYIAKLATLLSPSK